MFGLCFFLLPLQNSRIYISSAYTLRWETEPQFISRGYKGIKLAGVISNSSTKGMMAQTSMKISHSGHFSLVHSPCQHIPCWRLTAVCISKVKIRSGGATQASVTHVIPLQTKPPQPRRCFWQFHPPYIIDPMQSAFDMQNWYGWKLCMGGNKWVESSAKHEQHQQNFPSL